jgi:hypothetical protein
MFLAVTPHASPRSALDFLIVLCALACAGCAGSMTATPSMNQSPNRAILDEANRAGAWFHAKKTRPIWAKRIEQDQMVQTLEGVETVKAGHMLCRGEAGDIWPQTAEQLAKRYSPTEEMDAEGWRKHLPHPDAQGVMAIQIGHPFSVVASWGRLEGKAGDYLLKNYQDRDTDYPDDVWIVDQKLFAQTYAAATAQR